MEEELVYLTRQKLYSFIALFLSFLILFLCILVSNSRMEKEGKNDPVDKYFLEQKVLIETQNNKLQSKLDSITLKLEQNDKKLEKLAKQKSQIRYVYITDLQKIDDLNNDGIIKEFNAFFSKANSIQ